MNRSFRKYVAPAALLAFCLSATTVRAQVDSADDVCAPSADPCLITSTIAPVDDSVLDFGDREVQIIGAGRIDLGNRRSTILCGDMTVNAGDVVALKIRGANGFGQTDGGRLAINAQRACSINQDSKCIVDRDCTFGACSLQVCEGDLLRTCTDDASCQLGQCNANVCETGGRICSQNADCSFGPCDLTQRKCTGDPSVRCFSDLACSFGDCQLGDTRCASDLSLQCGSDQDCDLGNCDVDVCAQKEDEAYRQCSGDSDCFDGECTVGTGDVVINSKTRADGASAGFIDIRAAGNLTVNGFINANGNTADSDGGNIDLEAGAGDLVVNAVLQVSAGGASSGGEIVLTSGGDTTVNSAIDATGGDFDGGFLELFSNANVFVNADLDVSSTAGEGYGGEISVFAEDEIVVAGAIKLKSNGHQSAFNAGGDGGPQEFTTSGNVTFGPSVKIEAKGAAPDGSGGEILVESTDQDVIFHGDVSLPSNGIEGGGGTFEISSGGDILVSNSSVVDVTGNEFGGGIIDFFADGDVVMDGSIDASASNGGTLDTITFSAAKDIEVGGHVKIATSSTESANGIVDVEGCFVTVKSGAFIENVGIFGENNFDVAELLTVEAGAEISADPITGENLVRLRDITIQPIVNGEVSPTFSISEAQNIGECAECGNDRLEGGESCEDGNTTNGDGCSDDCQLETCIAQTPGYPNVPICDDSNGCTVDLCNPDTGNCEHAMSCDDGVDCTVDTCASDQCVNTPNNGQCDDGNVCTNDICGTTGCAFAGNMSPCDDGVACTVGDTCGQGTCMGSDNCPIGEQCSAGSGLCVPEGGVCGDGFVDGGEQCDDGDTMWAPGQSCNGQCMELICGDPNDDDRTTASDSLFALNTAVGVSNCDLCVCDVDSSGGVSASDALRLLNFAVSVPGITLNCPACP